MKKTKYKKGAVTMIRKKKRKESMIQYTKDYNVLKNLTLDKT